MVRGPTAPALFALYHAAFLPPAALALPFAGPSRRPSRATPSVRRVPALRSTEDPADPTDFADPTDPGEPDRIAAARFRREAARLRLQAEREEAAAVLARIRRTEEDAAGGRGDGEAHEQVRPGERRAPSLPSIVG
mmetsp:Transcript_19715/g.44762  ORF Transcript_19715/g.44762 Transcript_19715/m.44762 type:complete len:136 (-) Transcript_19715:357-764(-)